MVDRIVARKWTVFGIVLLVLVTLVMGWFIGRFIPGTPKTSEGDTITNRYPSGYQTGVQAIEDIDINHGETLRVEGVTQGNRYLFGNTIPDATIEDSGLSVLEHGAFELSVGETRVISGEALREWYPDFYLPDRSPIARFTGSKLPGKAFVVNVTVKNPSQTDSIDLPDLALWSEDLNQEADEMGAGAYPLADLVERMNPEGTTEDTGEGDVVYNGWTPLAPGESRQIAVPYYIYRNSFVSEESFEQIDLGRFCIEVNDYDPGIRYRFWLA